MRNRWITWIAALLLCSALGVLFSLPNLFSGTWRNSLLSSLAQWCSWGFIAPLIFWIDSRLPFKENHLGKRILVHLPVGVAVTILHFYLFLTLSAILRLMPWSRLANLHILGMASQALLWSWVVYWVIFGVLQTFRYYRHFLASELQLERTERNLSQARLNALRMQLDPHFLFNALNTISSQVDRDPRLTRAMIEHLGDLLRLSLESRNKQEIPLAEEFAFLEHYVAIQKIRFAESLRIEIRTAPEVKFALVPCLIMQPLVENAVRHGISPRASGGAVRVTAERNGNQVQIRVVDDGVGLPPGWSLESCSGMGLSVTHERIVGMHRDGAGKFSVRQRPEGGTEVEITLPLRLAEEVNNVAIA